ncbi:hypothetical protein EYF80_010836 [Liparis tanakae]|uniref:Uncharacterized protein n=1 Tax=Liparis tanakae TaxID=230148 RepID=A0A4Z2ILH7_9TELE|nr:hypothetical protein EYF80_010836 [Liparis tanakae]
MSAGVTLMAAHPLSTGRGQGLAVAESRGPIGRVPCNGRFDWLPGRLPPHHLRVSGARRLRRLMFFGSLWLSEVKPGSRGWIRPEHNTTTFCWERKGEEEKRGQERRREDRTGREERRGEKKRGDEEERRALERTDREESPRDEERTGQERRVQEMRRGQDRRGEDR